MLTKLQALIFLSTNENHSRMFSSCKKAKGTEAVMHYVVTLES